MPGALSDLATQRAYLLAYPAGHSLSPAMHNAAFAHLGLAADYSALEVPPERLAETVAGWRLAPSFLGANVTVPHKQAVIPLLDALTPMASAIGAVNTVLRRGGPPGGAPPRATPAGGRPGEEISTPAVELIGDNTDAYGFLKAVDELGVSLAGACAVVLGAGGSARAVVSALVASGAKVSVHNRSTGRATALVAELGAERALDDPSALAEALADCRLLVNTTSVGMAGGPAPGVLPLAVPLSALPRGAAVLDLVYRPALTPLLAAARARGLDTMNGLAMLVWQGAAAFEAWTGVDAPVAVMRAALERALEQEA